MIAEIYKYSIYNHGIGRFNLSSVIRPDIKNFDWKISDKSFNFCDKVDFNNNLLKLEKIKNNLILIQFTNERIWNSKSFPKKNCFFDLGDKLFRVIY